MAKTTIPAGYIAANAITSTELAANSVTAAAIASGAILSIDIGANSVSSTAIAANAVDSSEIASNAVGTSQIAGDAVTAAKIADNAVGSDQIAANAVGSSEVASNAIGTAQIAGNSVGISELNVSDGTNGQYLQTNGSGTLSFSTVSGYTDSDVETYLNTSAIYTDATNDRLGIGTSSPSNKLTINSTTGSGLKIYAADQAYARLTLDNLNGQAWDLVAGTAGASNSGFGIYDGDAGATRLQIDSSGNVGIGTTNTTFATGGKLYLQLEDTYDTAIVASHQLAGATENPAFEFFRPVGSNNDFYTYRIGMHGDDFRFEKAAQANKGSHASYSTTMHLDYNGNVGINWDAPTARLGIIQSGSSTPGLNITDGSTSDFHVLAGYSSGYCVIGPSAGALAIKTANTVRTTITSSGTLEHSGNNGTFAFGASSGNVTRIRGNADGLHMHYGAEGNPRLSIGRDEYQSGQAGIVFNEPGYGKANGGVGIGSASRGNMAFSTSDNTTFTERMRLTSDGALLVNRTSRFGAGGSDAMIVTGKTDAAIRITGANTSGYKWVEFYNGSLNQIGSISNNSNTNTSFNTSSDYRLKQNVNDNWDATSILKQLRPVEFTWIADETDEVHQGFLAHEVQEHLPFAVTGEKDAVQDPMDDGEGGTISGSEIKGQEMDYAKVVPLLAKTIQELEARITELENA